MSSEWDTHGFRVAEAEKYGVSKAIVLSTVRRWIEYKKRINKGVFEKDGKLYHFAYISSRGLSAQMPYLGKSAISKILKDFEDEGVLLSGVFNKIQWDKTKWYTIPSEFGAVHIPDINEEEVDINEEEVDDNTSPSDSPSDKQPRVFLDKQGEEIPLSTGDTYQADGWSPLEVMAMKKRAARALGIKKSSRWSQLSFGSAWDFKKAFKFYMGYEYAGTVYLDEMAKTLADWYEAGETRETIREMIIAFFASEKAQKITITPNSVFSPHTYNSWKQGKLKAEPKKRNFWE